MPIADSYLPASIGHLKSTTVQPISLVLTGDVMLGRLVNEALNCFGPAYPWGNTLPSLKAADLTIANLECVIASGGRPWLRWPKVVETLREEFVGEIPGVEQIQEIVERTLKQEGYDEIQEIYHQYRLNRAGLRERKPFLTFEEEKIKLSQNALTVLESRYLLKNERGKIIETAEDLFRRVARHVAWAEKKLNPHLTEEEVQRWENTYYGMIARLEFLPNSPTLMNAGTQLGQLAACFVLPVEDSLHDIYETLKNTALIHQSGGGTGFNFSHLRPKGDFVKGTAGIASGPVSFMKMYDASTEIIKQGSKRRGANVGMLNVNHPDILEFIHAKKQEGALRNFNISVGVTNEFMEKVKRVENYDLMNPRTGLKVGELNANEDLKRVPMATAMQGNGAMPTEIHRDDVRRLVQDGAQLVEMLSAKEYKQEHLPGAINIPLKKLAPQAMAKLRLDRPVIVYCADSQ